MCMQNRDYIGLLREYRDKGVPFCLKSRGASMVPTIWPRMRLKIVPYHSGERVCEGQIVAYIREDGNIVAHRVVGVEGGKVRTRGDSSLRDDKPVGEVDLLGEVRAVGFCGTWLSLTSRAAVAWGGLMIKTHPVLTFVWHAMAMTIKGITKLRDMIAK